MTGNTVKSWLHQAHLGSGHEFAVEMRHLVHERRFWGIVAGVAAFVVFMGFLTLAIWASRGDVNQPEYPYFYPYYFP